LIKTPIVFLVYKRIEETSKSLDAIKKVKPKELFIVADGPKDPKEAKKVSAVHAYINNFIDWKCNIRWNISNKNMGLSNRVSSGISWAFKFCDQAIIVEDDCVADSSFFIFCEELLEKYENNNNVGCITGNNFQDGQKRGTASYYFSDFPHCWGWATWKNAWKYYDHKFKCWNKAKLHIKQNFGAKGLNYFHLIKKKVETGEMDSWAFRWTFSLWARQMLTATPQKNLVHNIGCGKDATHTKSLNAPIKRNLVFPLTHPPQISKIQKADLYVINNHFNISNPPKINRFLEKDYALILKKKRFTSFYTNFKGRKIKCLDSKTLLQQNREIFGDEIYKFHTNLESPRIIDVGANIGLFMIYTKELYPTAEIIGFEPNSKMFCAAKYNISSFKFQNVKIINQACSRKEGILYCPSDREIPNEHRVEANFKKIQSIKLSKFLDKPVDFLKLQAKGFELDILNECRRKLINVRNLYLEYHYSLNKNKYLSSILRIIEEAGFSYHIEQNSGQSNSPILEKISFGSPVSFKVKIFCSRKTFST
jgi:FkbM family methyltransferase